MKKIKIIKSRKNTFETNSSSTHGFAFSSVDIISLNKTIEKKCSLNVQEDSLIINLGEYDWDVDILSNQQQKLEYLLTAIINSLPLYEEAGIDIINLNDINVNFIQYLSKYIKTHFNIDLNTIQFYNLNDNYIDYQSVGLINFNQLNKMNEEELNHFLDYTIFNSQFNIITGNDNDSKANPVYTAIKNGLIQGQITAEYIGNYTLYDCKKQSGEVLMNKYNSINITDFVNNLTNNSINENSQKVEHS